MEFKKYEYSIHIKQYRVLLDEDLETQVNTTDIEMVKKLLENLDEYNCEVVISSKEIKK